MIKQILTKHFLKVLTDTEFVDIHSMYSKQPHPDKECLVSHLILKLISLISTALSWIKILLR